MFRALVAAACLLTSTVTAQAQVAPAGVPAVDLVIPEASGSPSWGTKKLTRSLREEIKPNIHSLIAPKKLRNAQEELKQDAATRTSAAGLAAAARQTGAHYVLKVDVSRTGWLYTAHAQLINAASGEIQMDFRAQYYDPQDEAIDRGRRIAATTLKKLALLIGEAPPPAPVAVAADPPPPEPETPPVEPPPETLANVETPVAPEPIAIVDSPPGSIAEEEGEDLLSLQLRGNLIVGDTFSRLPRVEGATFKRSLNSGVAAIRGMAQSRIGELLAFEAHLVQSLAVQSNTFGPLGVYYGGDVEPQGRASVLNYRWAESDTAAARLMVDRLSLRFSSSPIDITVGRQPINLATTFFFTPNDFFAPFAAQAFYRVYKPGVDAARVEIELSELTQLSVIGVLGYERLAVDEDKVSFDQSAAVARFATTLAGFQWIGLGGKLPGSYFGGGAIEGELFEWLGVRAEGHLAFPTAEGRSAYAEISVGVEHHFESSLNIRIEQFYHGLGATSTEGYAAVVASGYLARHYSALGIGYELTPLLRLDSLLLVNWIDPSFLTSLNVSYSPLEDVELALTGSIPIGKGPIPSPTPGGPPLPQSELGTLPLSVSAEFRAYF